MTEPTRSTNAMKVCLGILWEIEVDDNIHSLNVDTTGEKIRADQVAHLPVTKVMEHTVAVLLQHFGVRVEAGVAKFGDFLCQQLHARGAVAEDDGLVDVQSAEQSVETMDLLFFLHESIILGNAAKGELVHEVDLMRVIHVFVLELLDDDGESGGEQHDLSVFGVELEQLLDSDRKLRREELVGFIHDKGLGL